MVLHKIIRCLTAFATIAIFVGCNSGESAPPIHTPQQWQDFWIADPFAGTRRIEIQHDRDGGRPDRYFIDDPKVIAKLMALPKVYAIENGSALNCEDVGTFTFVKLDDSAFRFRLTCSPGHAPIASFDGGFFYLDAAFMTGLTEHLAAVAGKAVDLTRYAKGPPGEDISSNDTPSHWLDVGFKWVEVDYSVGPRQSHVARITEQQDLDRLREALQTTADSPTAKGQPSLPAQDKHSPLVTLGLNDGRRLVGALANKEQWTLAGEHAALNIKPAFAQALSEIVSRLESRPIDVLTENAPAAPDADDDTLSRLIVAATSLRIPSHLDPPKTFTITSSDKLQNLLQGAKPIEQPLRDASLRATSRAAQVTTKDGQVLEVVFYDREKGYHPAGPAADGLPAVRRQFWVKPEWQSQLFQVEWNRRQAERAQRDLETTKAICQDLPTFFDQVLSVGIATNEGSTTVPISKVRPIVKSLRVKKVEPLRWTPAQWKTRIDDLQKAGSTTVKLTPGLNFDLELVEDGPHEALIPNYGRVILSHGRLSDFAKASR